MDIIFSKQDEKPLYEQIVSQIKAQIIRGDLKDGEPLPSIRGLAKDLKISVITTKRAYEELERDGFIISRAGRGCFVKGQNSEMIKEEKLKVIQNLFSQACDTAKECDISLDELKETLDIIYGGTDNE